MTVTPLPIRDSAAYEGWINRIRGRIFGVLCERDKGGTWEMFLDNIIIELLGYKDELDSIKFWALLGKLQTCRMLAPSYFRTTIFECMNLLEKVCNE